MKLVAWACLSLTLLVGCVVDAGLPSDLLDQVLGLRLPGDGGGATDEKPTPQSVADVFAETSDTPPTGQSVPEVGGLLTVQVVSKSPVAANVLVRFFVSTIEVRRTQLQVEPFAREDAIGPDLATSAEISGRYASGQPIPPLVATLGQDFVEGDTLLYEIPDPSRFTLTVTATPADGGSVSRSPDSPDYAPGTTVTLTAVPSAGHRVKAWIGTQDDAATGTTNTVVMTDNKTVTVEFEPIPCTRYAVTAGVDGAGGTIEPIGGSYCVGTVLSVRAFPGFGMMVDAWTGTDDDRSTAETNTVTVDGPRAVTVRFRAVVPLTYQLTTSVVGGHGTIAPAGGRYSAGEVVALTATPDPGYRVKAWTGTEDDAATSATNSVVMDGDKSVTVEFEEIPPPQYALLTAASPAGAGSVSRSPDQAAYAAGTPVQLTAVAAPGYEFDYWAGDLSGFANPSSIVMDAGKSVTAVFRIGTPPPPARVYVKADASGANNGRSWADAFNDLQDALSLARSAGGAVEEIWVAEGTYKPGRSGDRTTSFSLVNGVQVYGGFAGVEDNLADRSPAAHVTVLSGDLAGDDGPGFANYGENSYHVVTAVGVDSSTLLDGFMIAHGSANGQNRDAWAEGGGMRSANSSLRIVGCTFADNSAELFGGGLCAAGGTPSLDACSFERNRAREATAGEGRGAGVYGDGASLVVTRTRFVQNFCRYGGGLHVRNGNAVVRSCIFAGNTAEIDGGGTWAEYSAIDVANSVFVNNAGLRMGGAVFNWDGAVTRLTNCTLAANRSSGYFGGGTAIFSSSGGNGQAWAANCVLWANGMAGQLIVGAAAITYSCVQGGYAGTGNVDVDPLFVRAPSAGADGQWGTADDDDGDLALLPSSRCIDAGNSGAALAAGLTTDLAGGARFRDAPNVADTGVGPAPIVDMGAYESDGVALPPRLYVNGAASGANNGLDWANAFVRLQDALAAAGQFGGAVPEIWVARGTYRPAGPGGDRAATFQLVNGVAVYGGFRGDETDLGQRDVAANETVLSGDLAGDDATGGSNAENSYHVVNGGGTDVSAVLDGFTVSGGNASDAPVGLTDTRGAGMTNVGGSPVVRRCVFRSNVAAGGGGMFNKGGTPTLIEVQFVANRANLGGGMLNNNASPTLDKCVFAGNAAAHAGQNPGAGGGMYNWGGSSPVLSACRFDGNTASDLGGAVYNDQASPVLSDCDVINNAASTGAGFCDVNGSSSTLMGCSFAWNAGGLQGGGMYVDGGSPTLGGCTFTGNRASNGAGFFGQAADATLYSCTFAGNGTPGGYGGGAMLIDGGQPYLVSCVFLANSARQGAGVLSSESGMTMANGVFAGNTASSEGGALYVASMQYETRVVNCTLAANSAGSAGGGVYVEEPTATGLSLANCILWGNAAPSMAAIRGMPEVTYSCIQGGFPGLGNTAANPRFVDAAGPDEVPGTGDEDLRLMSGSPCVDSGDNTAADGIGLITDVDGSPRFKNDLNVPDTGRGTPPIVDMGAYERGVPGDLEGDGDVDSADFLRFQACFNGPNRPPAAAGCEDMDFNRDGNVDLSDFTVFLSCFNGPNRPAACM